MKHGSELSNSDNAQVSVRTQSLRPDVRFANMIRNLPQILFEIDTSGYWSFLNDSWIQLTGFTVDECLGTQHTDYVHPQDRRRCIQIFTKMQSGKVENCTDAFRFLTSDGKYLWTEIRASLSRSPENQPIGIVGTINNITNRISEEKLLLASQRALTAMLDDLLGMVYRCRNNPDWTMEHVSGSSHQLTGYYPKDIIDNKKLSYASMIHSDDKLRAWGEVQNGVRENRRFEMGYRIITEDSSEKWVWEGGKGIFSNNHELLGLEGMIIDITRRKMREQNQLKTCYTMASPGYPRHIYSWTD